MRFLKGFDDSLYIYLLLGVWTFLTFGLAVRELVHVHEFTKELALSEARTSYKKDIAIRQWFASHGGAYVPVDTRTPSNIYLQHVPERDIKTPSGVDLTLMNPAYAMRQMAELYAEQFGVMGHITSLKLLRPENKADVWETKALMLFDKGGKEISEFTNIGGKPFLRYMQPIIVQKSCLKCHAYQGYQVGDVRGGISISIPMTSHLAKERHERMMPLFSYSLLWIIGLGGIWLGGRKLIHSMEERDQAHGALLKHKQYLEEVVEKRTEELRRANKKLEYLSFTDTLTTSANRRSFDELILVEFSRAMRNENTIALIMIDIDYFKSFNDSYGHLEGDKCLKEVALVLNAEAKRSGDFVARYGGEEFVVVLPDTDMAGALVIAEKMRTKVEALNIENVNSKVSDHVTVSLGISSVIPKQNSNSNNLIQQADKALYIAKKQGRNQTVFIEK